MISSMVQYPRFCFTSVMPVAQIPAFTSKLQVAQVTHGQNQKPNPEASWIVKSGLSIQVWKSRD